MKLFITNSNYRIFTSTINNISVLNYYQQLLLLDSKKVMPLTQNLFLTIPTIYKKIFLFYFIGNCLKISKRKSYYHQTIILECIISKIKFLIYIPVQSNLFIIY